MSAENGNWLGLWTDPFRAVRNYWSGLGRYVAESTKLAMTAGEPFQRMQAKSVGKNPPEQVMKDTADILFLNAGIARESFFGALDSMINYHGQKIREFYNALLNTVLGIPGETIPQYWKRLADSTEAVVNYPKAIQKIKSQYGFHFDDGGYIETAENERFRLYQVLPTDPSVSILENAKPIIFRHPYVLGANILAFLPGEKKSLVHCFANSGVPTYVMIVKDINATPAVQVMTGEDDVLDTAHFCQQVYGIHKQPVTLFGLCQGGTMAMLAVLTGKLDGFVDQLITAVAPIDGSKSTSLVEYMNKLPPNCRDLGYSLTQLPSGAWVVSGEILAFVFKLRRSRNENPASVFLRDLTMMEKSGGNTGNTAAAINYWLTNDRTDLPPAIAALALKMYENPIAEDGTLPVTLFGKSFNLKRMNDMSDTHWYIAFAPADDMVEPLSAIPSLDLFNEGVVEVVPYSKGHVGIATSHPTNTSDCPLYGRFKDKNTGATCRGLVCAHLEGQLVN